MHSYRKETCSEECSELALSSLVLHVYNTLSANRHAYTISHFSNSSTFYEILLQATVVLLFILLHTSKSGGKIKVSRACVPLHMNLTRSKNDLYVQLTMQQLFEIQITVSVIF